MKTLSDGTEVLDRTYYYLLDFNESTKRDFIQKTFNKNRLCDLTEYEYWELFYHATKSDFHNACYNKKHFVQWSGE